MNFDKVVEAIIKEAQARGDFENLLGQGKPIDLTAYFNTPEDIRVAQAVLKNAGLVPVEIELLQEIAALKKLIGTLNEEHQNLKYQKSLEEKQLQFNLMMERRQRQRRK